MKLRDSSLNSFLPADCFKAVKIITSSSEELQRSENGVMDFTSSTSLSQVHSGLQAVLSVQQVRKMMEDGGKLQHVFTAAHVPQLQPRLLCGHKAEIRSRHSVTDELKGRFS